MGMYMHGTGETALTMSCRAGNGEAVSSLPCEHAFHEACISKWLCERRVACPMCNHDARETWMTHGQR